MKFTVEIAAFAAAVRRASSVIQARNVIPSLACVHIAADAGLRITATDLNEWITVAAPASVSAPGAICVRADTLSAWLAACPKGALVDCAVNGHKVTFRAGRNSVSMIYIPAEDFPELQHKDERSEVPNVIAAMETCLPYASEEDSRRMLMGVFVGGGHVVATNGYIACAVAVGDTGDIAATIPTSGVRQVIQSGPAARLFVGAWSWSCEDDGITMGGKLIGEAFLDWQRAVPSPEITVTVDADEIAAACGTVAVAAGNMKVRGIAITGDGTAAVLRCQGDLGEATAEVACEGPAFSCGINSKYAQTAMKTMAGRVISMGIADPILMTSPAAPETRVLVMQMRL